MRHFVMDLPRPHTDIRTELLDAFKFLYSYDYLINFMQ